MSLVSNHYDPAGVSERLRPADGMTRELMLEVIDKACRRFPSLGQSGMTARLTRLIEVEAWADAALTLLELELPMWQARRITYDGGEWYCALSRQRELPDWLDQSIEARHSDLALALLCAFVDAQTLTAPTTRASVPSASRVRDPLYEPLPCENFG